AVFCWTRVASDAPTCGETCRSISPSRGRMLGSVFAITGGKACHSYPIGQFPTRARARAREKIEQEHEHEYNYEQLPPEINHHRGHLGKIDHDPVGLILGQLRARKASGCDRNRARTD